MLHSRLVCLITLLCVGAGLVGRPPRASGQGSASAPAFWSFHHLSADAPALDIYVDGGRAISGLSFPDASEYIRVAAGSHRLQVTPAGRLDVLLSTATLLDGGRSYTWVLSGLIAGADVTVPLTPELQFSHVLPRVDNVGAAADSRPRVRVLNASPGSGPLDVRLDDPGRRTLASALTYGVMSVYTALEAGGYTFSVYPSGSSVPLLAHLGVLALQEQQAYTITLGGVRPELIAPNAPNPVQGLVARALSDQNTAHAAILIRGCNQVILNLSVGTPVSSLLARVDDPSLVRSIWRFDNLTKLLKVGYFSDPAAPIDYLYTNASPEAAFICVSATTNWNPPP